MAATTTQAKSIAPSELESELDYLDKGVKANLPAGLSFTIEGVSTNQAEIDTTLQGWIETIRAVDVAKAAYKDAVAARVAITVKARTYAKALKSVVKQHFGSESNLLASFGIAADKPVVATAQQKLVTAAKCAQTRKVRGTKGKKQRAAITVVGNPAVTVPSTGPQQISPPPVNIGVIGPTASIVPASTAAPATSTPAPASAGSGSPA